MDYQYEASVLKDRTCIFKNRCRVVLNEATRQLTGAFF
jgi:hypothetical protein